MKSHSSGGSTRPTEGAASSGEPPRGRGEGDELHEEVRGGALAGARLGEAGRIIRSRLFGSEISTPLGDVGKGAESRVSTPQPLLSRRSVTVNSFSPAGLSVSGKPAGATTGPMTRQGVILRSGATGVEAVWSEPTLPLRSTPAPAPVVASPALSLSSPLSTPRSLPVEVSDYRIPGQDEPALSLGPMSARARALGMSVSPEAEDVARAPAYQSVSSPSGRLLQGPDLDDVPGADALAGSVLSTPMHAISAALGGQSSVPADPTAPFTAESTPLSPPDSGTILLSEEPVSRDAEALGLGTSRSAQDVHAPRTDAADIAVLDPSAVPAPIADSDARLEAGSSLRALVDRLHSDASGSDPAPLEKGDLESLLKGLGASAREKEEAEIRELLESLPELHEEARSQPGSPTAQAIESVLLEEKPSSLMHDAELLPDSASEPLDTAVEDSRTSRPEGFEEVSGQSSTKIAALLDALSPEGMEESLSDGDIGTLDELTQDPSSLPRASTLPEDLLDGELLDEDAVTQLLPPAVRVGGSRLLLDAEDGLERSSEMLEEGSGGSDGYGISPVEAAWSNRRPVTRPSSAQSGDEAAPTAASARVRPVASEPLRSTGFSEDELSEEVPLSEVALPSRSAAFAGESSEVEALEAPGDELFEAYSTPIGAIAPMGAAQAAVHVRHAHREDLARERADGRGPVRVDSIPDLPAHVLPGESSSAGAELHFTPMDVASPQARKALRQSSLIASLPAVDPELDFDLDTVREKPERPQLTPGAVLELDLPTPTEQAQTEGETSLTDLPASAIQPLEPGQVTGPLRSQGAVGKSDASGDTTAAVPPHAADALLEPSGQEGVERMDVDAHAGRTPTVSRFAPPPVGELESAEPFGPPRSLAVASLSAKSDDSDQGLEPGMETIRWTPLMAAVRGPGLKLSLGTEDLVGDPSSMRDPAAQEPLAGSAQTQDGDPDTETQGHDHKDGSSPALEAILPSTSAASALDALEDEPVEVGGDTLDMALVLETQLGLKVDLGDGPVTRAESGVAGADAPVLPVVSLLALGEKPAEAPPTLEAEPAETVETVETVENAVVEQAAGESAVTETESSAPIPPAPGLADVALEGALDGLHSEPAPVLEAASEPATAKAPDVLPTPIPSASSGHGHRRSLEVTPAFEGAMFVGTADGAVVEVGTDAAAEEAAAQASELLVQGDENSDETGRMGADHASDAVEAAVAAEPVSENAPAQPVEAPEVSTRPEAEDVRLEREASAPLSRSESMSAPAGRERRPPPRAVPGQKRMTLKDLFAGPELGEGGLPEGAPERTSSLGARGRVTGELSTGSSAEQGARGRAPTIPSEPELALPPVRDPLAARKAVAGERVEHFLKEDVQTVLAFRILRFYVVNGIEKMSLEELQEELVEGRETVHRAVNHLVVAGLLVSEAGAFVLNTRARKLSLLGTAVSWWQTPRRREQLLGLLRRV